ncbi:hypothetical protein D3C76_1602380 [compost metagenome]
MFPAKGPFPGINLVIVIIGSLYTKPAGIVNACPSGFVIVISTGPAIVEEGTITLTILALIKE